jgi:hypothetical protein
MPKKPNKPSKAPEGLSEFERTMGRLVAVPKAEVDKEEAKWQRERIALRRKGKAKGKTKKRG